MTEPLPNSSIAPDPAVTAYLPAEPMAGQQVAATVVQAPISSGSVKEVGIAYLLWFFLGLFGGHQFYLGKTSRGLLYLFTLGGLFVLVFIDLFTLPAQVRQVNTQLAVGTR